MADNPSYKGYVPADLQKTDSAAASAASTTPVGSYDKIIRLPLKREGKYRFWFTYLYEDEETKKVTEGPRSPTIELGFDIPNLTRPVLNLTLTQSYRAYGVKFDIDPLSVQEDIVVFESLSANFANPYIVYVGTSNNITIQTGSTAQRWVKVVVRDKWLDTNRSESAILTVTPLNPDPDTTFTVENPATTSASASIDPKDLSGFSLVSTITWAVSTDLKTAGYALRWSTTNPATGTPLWEYASVTGRTTNTFTATGLIPNTTYYYQVAATTPYDVVNWTGAASGTFIASDSVGTAVGALARLKSFLAIGGATGDLFKIGTGIAQGINLSTVPVAVPTLTDGTYHGIILNKSTTNVGNNFWLTTGQFRVGNSTEFLYWNGTDLNLTGNIEATGGKFTGNVQLAIPTGGTTSGSLYAGASATSGARLRLNNLGLFAYDGLSADATVSITNDGVIDARKGYIGGWTVSGTAQTTGTISKNGTILDSNGNITLGDATGTLASIVRLSSSDATFRLWVGSQTASNAPFRVTKDGTLYASNAVIGLAAGSTIPGYATTASLSNYATTASLSNYVTSASLTSTLNSYSTTQQIAASYLPTTSFNKTEIVAKLIKASGGVAGKIDGGLLQAGTVVADAVVSTYVYTGVLTGNVIRTQVDTTFPRISLNEVPNKLTFHTVSGAQPGAIYGTGSGSYGRIRIDAPAASNGEVPYFEMYSLDATTSLAVISADVTMAMSLLQADGLFVSNRAEFNDRVYANTLGTGSGLAIHQVQTGTNAGYLKVNTSTVRHKHNINAIDKSNYLNIIDLLRPVTFNYNEDIDPDQLENVGLIAEDLENIPGLEKLVIYDTNNDPIGISYDKLPIFLILALKEMKEKLDALQP